MIYFKKHSIKAHAQGDTLVISYQHKTDETKKRKAKEQSLKPLFANLENQYTKAAVLLKGLRLRENMSQIEFAKKIKVTQANLSNMENGKRPIGKIVAKRIEKVFGANYRYFLE